MEDMENYGYTLFRTIPTEKKNGGDCFTICSKLSPHLYAFAEQNDSFYQVLGLRLHNNPLPMAYAS